MHNITCMPKRPSVSGRVREPAQVYLEADDRDLLARLAAETGLSKAEILRRGVRSFARELASPGPMLRFLDELVATSPREGGVAARHDDVLAEEYLERRPPRR